MSHARCSSTRRTCLLKSSAGEGPAAVRGDRHGGGGERLHRHGDRGHDHRPADDPDPGDRAGRRDGRPANLFRCLLLLAAGAAAVLALSWLLGHVVPYPVTAATNSQVAARVTPRLVDLVAALTRPRSGK